MAFKRIVLSVLVILAVMISSIGYSQSEISWGSNVEADIQKHLTQALNTYSLDKNYVSQNKEIFRTWVSGSIDLTKSTQRLSKIFNRTSYTQEIANDKLRLPTEKLNLTEDKSTSGVILKPQLQLQKIQTLNLKIPVTTIYREMDNNYSFLKLKDLTAANPLETAAAQNLAKTFLVQNRLLTETSEDKVGQIYIQNRRLTEEQTQEGQEKDYLVQQDIVFERYFQNKPVINSKIVVGIAPGNKEIVQFKHFNWTTANLKEARPISSQMLKAASATSAAQIKQRVEAKLTSKSIKVRITRVIPAWFQTKDTLIPVMVFDINTEYKSEIGVFSRNYLEVINLAGSDDALFPESQKIEQPTKAN